MELNKIAAQHSKDAEHLVEIFPVEIWKIILELLEDSTDLLNAWRSSNLFRDLLNPQRQFFLFPEVWDVLGLKYERSNDLSYREQDVLKYPCEEYHLSNMTRASVDCTACGRRRKIQWYSGILKLRLACKSWSEAITNFYQNIPQTFQRETNSKSGICTNSHWSQTHLIELSAQNPSQFLQHFQQTHGGEGMNRSPFLGSMLIVIYGYGGINERTAGRLPQFIDGVNTLTKQYGRHVRTLNLHEWGRVSNTSLNYTIFHDLLHSLPHLETLRVSEERIEEPTEQMEALSNNTILASPLPTISTLKFLSVETLNAAVFSEIIRKNCHVSKLEMAGWRNANINYISEKSLPNLRELSITINQDGDEVEDLENFQTNWPLKKLCLDFDHRNITDWTRVFGVVGKWKDTLTDLILAMPTNNQISKVNWAEFQPHLERIKNLKFVLPNYYTLDCILSLKDTLEFLEVRVPRIVNVDERKSLSFSADIDSQIKLTSFYENPVDSNVWLFCPKLRKIDFYEVLENSIYDQDNFKIGSYLKWDWMMQQKQ